MADTIELGVQSGTPQNSQTRAAESSLDTCDGGYAAWRLLLVAFVFEALLWGQSRWVSVFNNPTEHSCQDFHSPLESSKTTTRICHNSLITHTLPLLEHPLREYVTLVLLLPSHL